MGSAFIHRNRTGTESEFHGAIESASLLQGAQDGELFPFEAAKIYEKVDAMNREIDVGGLQAGDGGNLLALLAFVEGIAGHVGAGVVLYGPKKVVDWVVQIEKMDVRLKPQAQLRGISADKGFGL